MGMFTSVHVSFASDIVDIEMVSALIERLSLWMKKWGFRRLLWYEMMSFITRKTVSSL